MVQKLRPFIVASWHGHRDDENRPQPIREIWRNKFRPQRRNLQTQTSNVDLAVLDPEGRLIHSFDGFRRSGFGRRETLGEYTARELSQATAQLDLDESAFGERSLSLPDLESGTGVRIFVRLRDPRMRAYQAPVVEVVSLTDEDWLPLHYPDQERSVEAKSLKDWLSQIYPSGVMERTDPRTKRVYRIQSTEGKLSLKPAGTDARHRYAILKGEVVLTDEGPDAFSYRGKLEIVLTYEPSAPRVQSLRGVFEGTYPRPDRRHQQTRLLPLEAAIESRPN